MEETFKLGSDEEIMTETQVLLSSLCDAVATINLDDNPDGGEGMKAYHSIINCKESAYAGHNFDCASRTSCDDMSLNSYSSCERATLPIDSNLCVSDVFLCIKDPRTSYKHPFHAFAQLLCQRYFII